MIGEAVISDPGVLCGGIEYPGHSRQITEFNLLILPVNASGAHRLFYPAFLQVLDSFEKLQCSTPDAQENHVYQACGYVLNTSYKRLTNCIRFDNAVTHPVTHA